MKLLRSKLSKKYLSKKEHKESKKKKKLKKDVKMISKTQQKFKSKSCNVSTE